jgi:hypothetical protein
LANPLRSSTDTYVSFDEASAELARTTNVGMTVKIVKSWIVVACNEGNVSPIASADMEKRA